MNGKRGTLESGEERILLNRESYTKMTSGEMYTQKTSAETDIDDRH